MLLASARCTLDPNLAGTVNGVDHDTVSCQSGSRAYFVSKSKVQRFPDARTFCSNVGKGLALWEDTDVYKDMKSITSSDVFDEPIWTALNNMGRKSCDMNTDISDCDGKLVRSEQITQT